MYLQYIDIINQNILRKNKNTSRTIIYNNMSLNIIFYG